MELESINQTWIMDNQRKSNARSKKAKTRRKPKRPLSAFNLFYRFKREKMISQGNLDRDAIASLVKTAPGLEDYHPNATQGAPPHALNDLRRMKIRNDMEHNLLPRDTRDRSHRTNHKAINGAMSFIELGKLMNKSWQDCDEFAKSVFRELAEEGRVFYRQRLEEYSIQNAKAKTASVKINEPTKNDECTTKNVPEKASPRLASLKDDVFGSGSVVNAMAGPPRVYQPYGYNLFNHPSSYCPHPSSGQCLSTRDHQVLKMASDYQGAVPTHCNTSQEIEPYHSRPTPSSSESEEALQARVKELEGQLVHERLRARVMELESDLAKQKADESRMRAQLEVLTTGRSAAAVAAYHRLPVQGDGLWSRMSAGGMIPPASLQEGSLVLSRTVARRDDSAVHYMVDQRTNNVFPNKKPRRE